MPESPGTITSIIQAWKSECSNKLFGVKVLFIPVVFLGYAAIAQRLSHYIETREGIRLDDTLLNFFPRIDFSAAIFTLLYSSIIIFTLAHLDKPRLILRMIEMHLFVAL